jgi:hypothetical protein
LVARGDMGQRGEKGKTGTSDSEEWEGKMRGESVEGCSKGKVKGGKECGHMHPTRSYIRGKPALVRALRARRV